ncbi:MAG: hypothetical protein J6O60_02905 [Lachnospiraceae bacterium]|nr:hypothetical protein [Lachnospiraceae bacterium]
MGDRETSHFDKHLDELLYLYAESNIDVFVFEDIDRFNNVEIFERLRYINELLNESERYKQEKGTIRFLYLVRDDLLLDEKTKFFDFIIPIVPFVSAENSYEKAKTRIESIGINLDDFMLRGIFAYISDYRLLTNIINEYLIYEKCIVMPSRDDNKLFALVVYKNVFPDDFSKLKDNEGYLYHLLSYKKDGYAGRKQSFKIELQENGNEKKELIKEFANNDNEYELVYFLLSNGYIDESYPEYISSYDGIRMNENDHKFYMNLFNSEGLAWDYSLDNPQLIFERLKIYDFEQPRILNFDIAKYAMTNEMEKYLDPLFTQLKNNHKIDFLVDYLNWSMARTTIEEKSVIVKCVDSYWKDILLEDDLENYLFDFVCYLLRFAKYNCYKNINNADLLKNYLLSNVGILPKLILENENEVENFKDGLTCMNICFPSVNLAIIDERVGKTIIDTNSYELNSDNLEMFMSYFSDVSDNKPIARFKALPQAVRDAFLEKADNTYNDLFGKDELFYDDEKEVIELLNDPDIGIKICEKYIVKMGSKVCDGDLIKYSDVMELLAKHNRLAPTLYNLDLVYKELVMGASKPLSNYLVFINCLTENEYKKYADSNKELYDALSKVNGIESNVYRTIVKIRAEKVKPVTVSGLTREQYRVLLEENLLDNSMEIFKHIYSNYAEDREILIKTDFADFEQCLKVRSISVQANVLSEILDYDISDDEKMRILALVPYEIPVRANYSLVVKEKLLSRVTTFDNIKELVDSYAKLDENEKKELLNCVCRIFSKLGDEIVLPYRIVFDLVSKKMVKLDCDLVAECTRKYSKTEVKKLLKKGQLEDYLQCLEHKEIPEGMSEDSATQAFRARKWVE